MFCKKCGNKLSDAAAFCEKCGTPVSGTASASTVQQGGLQQSAPMQQGIPMQHNIAPQYYAVPQYTNGNKGSKKKLIIPAVLLAAAAVVLIAAVVLLTGTGKPNPVNGNYDSAQWGGGTDSNGQGGNGSFDGQGGGSNNWQNGGSSNGQEENAGVTTPDNGNPPFGVDTTPNEKPEEYYTSEKTGTTFTIPSDAGYAQISIDGNVNIVPARLINYTPTQFLNCTTRVWIYLDGQPSIKSEQRMAYSFSVGSKWETGGTYEFNDLCSSRNSVGIWGVYRHYYSIIDQYTDGIDSHTADYADYFDDACFHIISLNSSNDELVCYFYLEIHDDSSSHVIEGVANLVREY